METRALYSAQLAAQYNEPVLRSIELFTGAGGLALGTQLAHFRHVALIEKDDDACRTLRVNTEAGLFPGLAPESLVPQEVLATTRFRDFTGSVAMDLVAGGPPCQPFSIGGKHRGLSDVRNLFPHYVRAIAELTPKAFILENVRGRFLAIALLNQPRFPLGQVSRFYGAGVYALYYNGPRRLYKSISKTETPIYVGKSDPTDPLAKTPIEQGECIARRLRDHKDSIEQVKFIDISDFEYRVLIVQSGWQAAAESYLIERFLPVWNDQMKVCGGFGKHGDNGKVRANSRSFWDTLHPGRRWAHT